ncbi:universal stress protein [Suttonella ornithocola]|uniref:Universal stress protein G n=1 Tax=Suttonella ornithocola TaxID=279832 RepID=A0A380MTE1_9GAMM|nr:universal stress protein [Suttonella ornithocola]SUO95552.1 Universal stress protein G [Suttonella ornithocola]
MKTVLAAVDLEHPQNARRIVAAAQELAKDNGQIYLITVISMPGNSMVTSFLPKDYGHRVRDEMQTRLTQFAQEYLVEQDVKVMVRSGSVYEEIVRFGEEIDTDVTVIASGKPGKVGLGGNALRIAQHSTHPIFILR